MIEGVCSSSVGQKTGISIPEQNSEIKAGFGNISIPRNSDSKKRNSAEICGIPRNSAKHRQKLNQIQKRNCQPRPRRRPFRGNALVAPIMGDSPPAWFDQIHPGGGDLPTFHQGDLRGCHGHNMGRPPWPLPPPTPRHLCRHLYHRQRHHHRRRHRRRCRLLAVTSPSSPLPCTI